MNEQALFHPIRRRLVLWAVLVVTLILALLGTTVYLTLSRVLVDQVDRDLVSRNTQAVGAPGGPHPGDRDGYNGGTFFIALDPTGQVQFNPQQVAVDGITWPTPKPGGVLATVTVNGEATRIFVTRAGDGDVLITGESLRPERAALRSLLMVLAVGGGFGLVLSIWGAWFLSGRALIPIQQAFRRQQEFIADASHELRTPLTVLRSATDLMYQHRGERLADQADLLDDVRTEIVRMEHLAEDLLTLARSDRGELQLLTAPVDLSTLASDVARRVGPLAARRGQTVELASNAQAVVDVDPDRIQQVLMILLDNAIKYTPDQGRISVLVRHDARMAVVEVSDTGRGIAPEHLPRLFDRFYRADAARSRAAGGTGLGLAIAKLLVDAHGGELSISSVVDEGTTARIRLPLTHDAEVTGTRSSFQVAPQEAPSFGS